MPITIPVDYWLGVGEMIKSGRFKNSSEAAFTLLELTLVFLVIGLLVGVIIGGYQLISSAERVRLSTHFDDIESVVRHFETQFGGLPGDLSNAGSLFSSCVDLTDQPCNGDGDGLIEVKHPGNESMRAWAHLASADLIKGEFTSLGGGSTGLEGIPGENVPSSVMRNSCSILESLDSRTVTIKVGSPNTDAPCNNSLLSVAEAFELDSKIDDGDPVTGKVQFATGQAEVDDGSPNACHDGVNFTVSSEGRVCRVIYLFK